MKTLGILVATALVLAPAVGRAADKKEKDKKIEVQKPVLDLKLDDKVTGASTTGTGEAKPAAGAADPNKPAKPALDVSKMMFDAESIRQVVKHHMPEIQECYEKVLADTGQKLEGRVIVGVIIDPAGMVSDARVLVKKSTLKDDRIHDCVLAIRRWAFPPPGDNRDHPIEYPFDLKVRQ